MRSERLAIKALLRRVKTLPLKTDDACPLCSSVLLQDDDGSIYCSSSRCSYGLSKEVNMDDARSIGSVKISALPTPPSKVKVNG